MERERGALGGELGPVRRLESQRQRQVVAIERQRALHVADEHDGIVDAHGMSPRGVGRRWRSFS